MKLQVGTVQCIDEQDLGEDEFMEKLKDALSPDCGADRAPSPRSPRALAAGGFPGHPSKDYLDTPDVVYMLTIDCEHKR